MSDIEIILAILAFIPLYLDLAVRFWKRDKINFLILRVHTESRKPIESSWTIRILHPNRAIEKCSVFVDGVKIPWSGNPNELRYEGVIYQSGGENFLIPKGIEKDSATVIIKDGNKVLRKRRFKDIPLIPN
jgi:hypothetical protein